MVGELPAHSARDRNQSVRGMTSSTEWWQAGAAERGQIAIIEAPAEAGAVEVVGTAGAVSVVEGGAVSLDERSP